MNSMAVKDKLKNVSEKMDVNFNMVLRFYMYDRFVERLAESKYKDNFILKGGFYLSTLFGISNRSTMDIDTAIRNVDFDEPTILKMIEEIININLNDNAILKVMNISSIREEDEYGGYRVNIQVRINDMKESFHIDVATGDPIIPKALTYKYKPILGSNYINLWAYSIETQLAEKLETILSRAEVSSRMRDYYDLYLIYTKGFDSLNKNNLGKAIETTFDKRNFQGNISQIVDNITNSDILKIRWESYSRKNKYAEDISYEQIIKCIEDMINIIEVVAA